MKTNALLPLNVKSKNKQINEYNKKEASSQI